MLAFPQAVLKTMRDLYADTVQKIEKIEKMRPKQDMSNWACYYYYNCNRVCERGPCIFAIIFLVQNWLTEQKKFEHFIDLFHSRNEILFLQFAKKDKEEAKKGKKKSRYQE